MTAKLAAVATTALYRRLLDVPAKMAPRAALRITKLWKVRFAAGQDAYGQPWARLAPSTLRRKRGPGIMRESEATYDATRAVPAAGAGVRLTTGPIAAYHQEGSGTRPARPVIPDRGVPSEWIAALAEIGVDVARKAVR